MSKLSHTFLDRLCFHFYDDYDDFRHVCRYGKYGEYRRTTGILDIIIPVDFACCHDGSSAVRSTSMADYPFRSTALCHSPALRMGFCTHLSRRHTHVRQEAFCEGNYKMDEI